MPKAKVLIIMGSEKDRAVMEKTAEILDYFGVSHRMEISSAHRHPDKTRRLAEGAEREGVGVIIAGAGMAAHLPGVVASFTSLPVIGVPLSVSSLSGLDALLSIVQMPSGVPVATMAVGEAGARNAGILAAQILALSDQRLKRTLREFKKKGSRMEGHGSTGKKSSRM